MSTCNAAHSFPSASTMSHWNTWLFVTLAARGFLILSSRNMYGMRMLFKIWRKNFLWTFSSFCISYLWALPPFSYVVLAPVGISPPGHWRSITVGALRFVTSRLHVFDLRSISHTCTSKHCLRKNVLVNRLSWPVDDCAYVETWCLTVSRLSFLWIMSNTINPCDIENFFIFSSHRKLLKRIIAEQYYQARSNYDLFAHIYFYGTICMHPGDTLSTERYSLGQNTR